MTSKDEPTPAGASGTGDAKDPTDDTEVMATTQDDDVADLQAERDRLAAQVEHLEAKVDRRGKLRSTAVGILVIFTCLSLMAATLAVWTKRNVLDTDRWMEHVGPIAEDPAVQAVLTERITARIMEVIDPKALFQEVLPDKGQILAVPLTNAVEGFVHDEVAKFVASPTFDRLWVEANRRAHATAVKVLEGDSQVVRANDGSVTLDLIPVVNAVLAQIGQLSPDIFGRTVDIPTITVDDLPKDSVAKLNAAFGLDLPDTYGQITIYDDGTLKEAQQALNLFQKVEALLVILTLVLIPLCIWLSHRRRRTILQLSVGSALGIVLIRRLALTATASVVGDVKGASEKDAVQAVIDQFLDALMWGTGIILAIAVAVAAVAAVTGPYRWAVKLREVVRTGGVAAGHAMSKGYRRADEVARDESTAVWLVDHKAGVQFAGAAVAVLVLLLFDLSWLATLLLLALLAAYEVAASRLGGNEGDEDAPDGTDPDASNDTGTPAGGAVATA